MLQVDYATVGQNAPGAAGQGATTTSPDVPDEIWRNILERCDLIDRAPFACISRQMKRVAYDPVHGRTGAFESLAVSEKRRARWHVATKQLSRYGRALLRGACMHAEAGIIDGVEDCLRRIACDAQLDARPVPPACPVWASMLPRLLTAATQAASRGDAWQLGQLKKRFASVARKCGAVEQPPVFKALSRQCARLGLEEARAQTIKLARDGHIEAVLANLEHVCRYAEEAEDEQFSADGFRRECLRVCLKHARSRTCELAQRDSSYGLTMHIEALRRLVTTEPSAVCDGELDAMAQMAERMDLIEAVMRLEKREVSQPNDLVWHIDSALEKAAGSLNMVYRRILATAVRQSEELAAESYTSSHRQEFLAIHAKAKKALAEMSDKGIEG